MKIKTVLFNYLNNVYKYYLNCEQNCKPKENIYCTSKINLLKFYNSKSINFS